MLPGSEWIVHVKKKLINEKNLINFVYNTDNQIVKDASGYLKYMRDVCAHPEGQVKSKIGVSILTLIFSSFNY